MSSNLMKAPDVDYYIRALDRNGKVLNEKSIALVKKLFEVLSALKSDADDRDLYTLWIYADRGTIEDFGDYEEMKEFGEVKDYADYERQWKEAYPNERSIYEMVAVHDNGYYNVVINNRLVIEVSPHRMDDYDNWRERLDPFLQYLVDVSKEAIEQLKAGTYNQYIADHVPNHLKTGLLKRSDEWMAYPDSKQYSNEGLTDEECQRFAEEMTMPENTEMPDQLLDAMTAEKYYHYCSLCYKANAYKCEEMSEKQQYYKFADGRDGDLKEIDPKSPEEYREWLFDDRRFGSHPWEIIRGGNTTHLSLYVIHREGKYYLMLDGLRRRAELVRSYFALKRENVPVVVNDGQRIAEAIQGKDYIGIVPHCVIPKYCDNLFPDVKIITFMHFYNNDEDKGLLSYITWYDIPPMQLKGES